MEVQAWMCASEEVRRCGSVEVKKGVQVWKFES